jgi:hypothetical protein
MNCPVRAKLPKGTGITIIEQDADGWSKIRIQGYFWTLYNGFVPQDLLKKSSHIHQPHEQTKPVENLPLPVESDR